MKGQGWAKENKRKGKTCKYWRKENRAGKKLGGGGIRKEERSI